MHLVRNNNYKRDDLAEFCGGAARVTIICSRRQLQTGENFDLLTGFDLNKPNDQKAAWYYLEMASPIVILMSPNCTPFGPLSNFNSVVHPQTWQASYNAAAPHGRFCGQVALYQDKKRAQLHDRSTFGCEQPNPSKLYEEHPWPVVLSRPGVSMQAFHQCMTGQRGPSGLPAKKPTGMTSNDEELRSAVKPFWCDNSHEHCTKCTGKKLRDLRLWTWPLATALATSVVRICNENATTTGVYAGTTTSYPDCTACRGHRHKDDPTHIRIQGKCYAYGTEPQEWTCDACKQRRVWYDGRHPCTRSMPTSDNGRGSHHGASIRCGKARSSSPRTCQTI